MAKCLFKFLGGSIFIKWCYNYSALVVEGQCEPNIKIGSNSPYCLDFGGAERPFSGPTNDLTSSVHNHMGATAR